MNNLINYILESGIVLGLFTLFYLLVLKQEKSFVFNRFYLLGSTVLALLLPFIHFSLESVPSSMIIGTILLEPLELETTSQSVNAIPFELIGYGIISLLLLLRLLYNITPLLYIRNKAIIHDGFKIITLKNSVSAYTFWNIIYLGDQLDKEEKTLILSHEKVHAIEKHSLDIIFFELAHIILWINPILLIIKGLARTNHEYLADAKVLNRSNKETYIKSLATQAIKSHGFELAHAFHSSSTLKRIKMINQQNNQIMKIKQVTPFILGIVLVFALGCDDAAEQLSEMDDQEAVKAIADVQTSKVQKSEGLEGVYDMVDKQPLPENGMTSFYQWVAENMEYPTQAKKDGVEGKVYVQFIVDEFGKITEVKSIKGIGGGCDAEAERVMKSAANWSPGEVDGKPVKVRMIMPFTFRLNS